MVKSFRADQEKSKLLHSVRRFVEEVMLAFRDG
jgi:hypothetical protein